MNSNVAVKTLSRTALVTFATALGVGVGGCGLAGVRSSDRPVPSPPACDQTLVVGHVPGHLDRVWQLTC